jgi:hypothetical protein
MGGTNGARKVVNASITTIVRDSHFESKYSRAAFVHRKRDQYATVIE